MFAITIMKTIAIIENGALPETAFNKQGICIILNDVTMCCCCQ
jgi:hypothetical protein